jgi:RHS repeat-associated protein
VLEIRSPAGGSIPQEEDATLIVHHVGIADSARMGDNPCGEIGINLANGIVSGEKITTQARSAIHFVNGIGASGPGSADTIHPLTGNVPTTGPTSFNFRVYEYVVYSTKTSSIEGPVEFDDTFGRYRHEDHLGSLVGTTANDGMRMEEYDYSDFGAPIRRLVAFDGQLFNKAGSLRRGTVSKGVRVVRPSTGDPTVDTVVIELQNVWLEPGELAGYEFCISDSEASGSSTDNYQMTATVLANSATRIELEVKSSRIWDALTSTAYAGHLPGFVVYKLPEAVQRGCWLNVSLVSVGGTTYTKLEAGYSVTTPGTQSGQLFPFTDDHVGRKVRISPRDGTGYTIASVEDPYLNPWAQTRYNAILIAGVHNEPTPQSPASLKGNMAYPDDRYWIEAHKIHYEATQGGVWYSVNYANGKTTLVAMDDSDPWSQTASTGPAPNTREFIHFEPFQNDWMLQPDAKEPVYFRAKVVDVRTLQVEGDITGIVEWQDRFRLLAPPGTNGNLRRGGARARLPWVEGSRALFAGYRYDPPSYGLFANNGYDPNAVGAPVYVSSLTSYTGRKLGWNLQGQYNCQYRQLDPYLGRFISPDPLLTPFWNPAEYAIGNPLSFTDPTGLSVAGEVWDGVKYMVGEADDALQRFYEWGTTPLPPDTDLMEFVHLILQAAGFFPVIGEFFDLIDAGVYLAEGKYADAALSAAAMIPVAGAAVTGGRWGVRAAKMAKKFSKAEDLAGMPRGAGGLQNVVRQSVDTNLSFTNHATHNYLRKGGINPLNTGRLRREIGRSDIGKKILAAADEDIIHLETSVERVQKGLYGRSVGNMGWAYLRNTQSYSETAVTLIHEGVHALGVRGSRRAEALARIAEYMHNGIPIDARSIRRILEDIKGAGVYSHLPWRAGRSTPHFPGLGF